MSEDEIRCKDDEMGMESGNSCRKEKRPQKGKYGKTEAAAEMRSGREREKRLQK